jgi:hypothetical protein
MQQAMVNHCSIKISSVFKTNSFNFFLALFCYAEFLYAECCFVDCFYVITNLDLIIYIGAK